MLDNINKLSNEEISKVNGGASNSNYFEYIVKSGDTLTKIASKYETTVNTIVQINGLSNPNNIRVGQKIYVPYKKAKY